MGSNCEGQMRRKCEGTNCVEKAEKKRRGKLRRKCEANADENVEKCQNSDISLHRCRKMSEF